MSKNTKRSEIAERIVEKRKAMNITQEEMANLLEINRNRYARYETNTRPPINMIAKIAKVFGVTADELISGDNVYLDVMRKNNSHGTTFHLSNKTDYQVEIKPQDDNILSEFEIELVANYRGLSDDKKKQLISFINWIKNE